MIDIASLNPSFPQGTSIVNKQWKHKLVLGEKPRKLAMQDIAIRPFMGVLVMHINYTCNQLMYESRT